MTTTAVLNFSKMVGSMMRMRRELAEVSLADVAEKMRMTTSGWSRIETGDTQVTVDKLSAFADLFGCKAWEILKDAEVVFSSLPQREGLTPFFSPEIKKPSARCSTCDDSRIVNTPWPSGYPHAFPCPECRPDTPCNCGASGCPGPAAVSKWRLEQMKELGMTMKRAEPAKRETPTKNDDDELLENAATLFNTVVDGTSASMTGFISTVKAWLVAYEERTEGRQ